MVTRELQKEQLSWYESNLPLGERKKRGHFSTPPTLVKSILDACGYTPEVNLTKIRVLDPACGSGNFLVGAAQRLAAFGRRMALTQAEHTALISQNLWGLDPDPVACFLAEMQLRALLEDADTQLHIHQADALALPWEACVDLFVTNPPYLAAKNNDLSGYRTAQRGQSDSYLLFLSLALQVVRPNGWVGLVLPDPLLARSNAATERARLLEEFTIHHLWHLSGVFTAEVGAVVIVAQKKSSQPLHHISWLRERWQSISKPQEGQAKTVSQALFLRQPSAEFRYLLSSERGAAVEQLRAHLENATNESRYFAPLQAFLSIARGEELGRESPYLTQNVVSANNSEPGWEDKAGRLLPGGQGRLAGRLLPGGQGRLAGRPQGSPLPYTRYGESIVYGGGDPCGPYTGRFFRGEGQRGGGTEGTRKQSTAQAFSDEVGGQQGGGTEGTRKGPPPRPATPASTSSQRLLKHLPM